MVPVPPPRVDPRDLRPRRAWYWVGGILIVLGIVGGMAGFAIGLYTTLRLPDFSAEFGDGETETFQVDQVNEGTRSWLLYTDEPLSSMDIQDACTIDGPDDSAGFQFAGGHEVEYGDEYWQLAAEISVNEPGRYQISCSDAGASEYGVGYGDNFGGMFIGIFGTLAATFVPPVVGAVLGGVTLIVTGVRRSGHKARLIAQRGYPPAA